MFNLLNISLFTACKNKKYLIFIQKPNIKREAIRVNKILFFYIIEFGK
jgi:hypothetical protein